MSESLMWAPKEDARVQTRMAQFARAAEELSGTPMPDYASLLGWSINEPNAFQQLLWDILGVIGDKGSQGFVAGADIRSARFYPGAKLNYAENLLRDADDRLAIIAHRDDGTRRSITRLELHQEVSRAVQALRAAGVAKGDRVAGILTHDIEAIIAYLATAAIGAIWSSCSPDFGPAGASDRLGQVDPKVLIAVPGYSYAGKSIDTTPTLKAVIDATKLEKVVLVGGSAKADLGVESQGWEEFLGAHEPGEIAFERMGYEAPLVILFSSGTTGKPKCIMHSAMGLLIQHMKEEALQCDISAKDRFFYFTTLGWMMWNWQVSGLALGATLVTYDGNPFYPEPSRLINLIDAEKITVFGTSAKYIDACLKAGVKPRESHDLSSLRQVLSTGSPLVPPSFDYVYADWKNDVHLASISGGTDICACFLGGNPISPVHRGELQGAMLGMDIAVLDNEGRPVLEGAGELVCRNPHLSMPLGFWGDTDGTRYRAAYFEKIPGVWSHGDFVEQRPSGGYIIHGRSDTTLNPGGVRIGTAEIYRQVERIDAVEEAIAVGQDWDGDSRVVLFVKLRAGLQLDDDLMREIKRAIRAGASPRHVPAKIIQVSDIPRTRSGKISEIAVRDTIHGRPVKNTTALANPEALELYANLEALQH